MHAQLGCSSSGLGNQDNPSEQTLWRTDLFDFLRATRSGFHITSDGSARKAVVDTQQEFAVRRLEAWCLGEADDLLALHEFDVDAASRLKLANAIAAAV